MSVMGMRQVELLTEPLAVLEEYGLSQRTLNALDAYLGSDKHVAIVKDLLMCTRAQLFEIPNFAEVTYEEVRKALELAGFHN